MREMKDSGIAWIGVIPQDWEIVRTKSLYCSAKEIVGDRADDFERLALTLNGVIKRSKEDSVGLQPEKFSGYQILKKGELVFKLIDLENVATSRVGLSPYTGIVSPAYIVLSKQSRAKDLVVRYSMYHFLSMWQREIFNQMGDNGVRSSLNTKELLNIPHPFPSIYEQKRIVTFLDAQCAEIDAVLEKTRASIEEYKKLKQAVITQAVTKGIRGDRPMKNSGIEWIGDIPESWEVSSVRYIGQLQNGISKGGEFFGKGFPFVSYGDVYKNYELPHSVSGLIDTTEDERAKYSVEYGDIFFTRTSETIEEVGFSCVCKRSIPNATFAGFIIRLRPFCADEKILTDYAKYYFRGEHIRAYLVKEMNLVTRASLGQTLLKGMSVIVPPKSVQKEIAEYLDDKCADIDALVAKKQQYLTEIENYKKSLIYEYVTGKKEVV
jgi:type I restriction enzyme S subunit